MLEWNNFGMIFLKLRTARFNLINSLDPCYSCISCHEFKFRPSVHRVEPASVVLSDRVDLKVVTENPKLFVKLDSHWICQTCSSSVRVPKLCAKNHPCPWEGVPKHLLNLNLVNTNPPLHTNQFS